jgi:hypothetical protein
MFRFVMFATAHAYDKGSDNLQLRSAQALPSALVAFTPVPQA